MANPPPRGTTPTLTDLDALEHATHQRHGDCALETCHYPDVRDDQVQALIALAREWVTTLPKLRALVEEWRKEAVEWGRRFPAMEARSLQCVACANDIASLLPSEETT